MADQLKPIKVWGQDGPNPPKVAMLLEELDIAHEIIGVPLTDVKKPEYLAINPNGRVPAIYDPNTDLTLWESGAIMLYLIERYDREHALSFPSGSKEAYLAQQWLFFQATGQGPYYGQFVWFDKGHPEKLPSALERYVKEASRVTRVLEEHLQKEKENTNAADGPWLVGGKCSYADIAFVVWQLVATAWFREAGFDPDQYPLVKDWMLRLTDRPAIGKIMQSTAFLKMFIPKRDA